MNNEIKKILDKNRVLYSDFVPISGEKLKFRMVEDKNKKFLFKMALMEAYRRGLNSKSRLKK